MSFVPNHNGSIVGSCLGANSHQKVSLVVEMVIPVLLKAMFMFPTSAETFVFFFLPPWAQSSPHVKRVKKKEPPPTHTDHRTPSNGDRPQRHCPSGRRTWAFRICGSSSSPKRPTSTGTPRTIRDRDGM